MKPDTQGAPDMTTDREQESLMRTTDSRKRFDFWLFFAISLYVLNLAGWTVWAIWRISNGRCN